MSTEKTTRRYQLRKRADAMEATRRRITEAAMELHGTLGPARTTMTAVAERAGVQRQTVYRHFADEEELLRRLLGALRARHPWPDAERWRAIADPAERLRRRARRALRLVRDHRGDVDERAARRDARRRARPGAGPRSAPTSTTRRARSPRAGARAAGAARCSSPRPATPSTSTPGARSQATAAISRAGVVELTSAMVSRAASR